MTIDIEVQDSQNVIVDVTTEQPTIEIKNTGAAIPTVLTPLPSVSTEDDGKVLQVVGGKWAASEFEITSDDEDDAYIGDVVNRIEALEEGLADVLYEEISILSFTNSVNTAELGSTVTKVSFSWGFNKEPVSVTIDGNTVGGGQFGAMMKTDYNITANKMFTISATDERDATATKTTSINFYNRIRYGAAANYTDLILSDGVLSNTKGRSFTVTAGEGQYIWYILPKRIGACTFKVGGFDGGFTLFATETLTNASGYSEEYYIYKSDNAALGKTEVTVS